MPKVLELSSKEESVVISRLEAFLPKIRDANAELEKQVKLDPASVDIENVDEESGEQYIEMDLGLGVFDLKKDVKEEDIIINPGASNTKATSTSSKPIIQMMETDSDTSSSIPKQQHTTPDTQKDKDEDVTMA
ncbi:hypothetical protein BGW41_002105 [Actinomortierella wolfii]|nr:hypothetical protein BGW41_002105 [Actinomortierella wolfii]